MENTQMHCGYICIIGRPNVGKSTLMNHLIGQKISITSRKPQTTQMRVNGVLTKDDYQYIFVDTPGFQQLYINKLNKLLNKSVINSLMNVDVVLLVVEAGLFNKGDEEVLKLLPPNSQVILVVNKEDKLKSKLELDDYIRTIKHKYTFSDVTVVAAKHHTGIEELLAKIRQYIPLGQFLYPEEWLTDRSSKFLVAEIIREKLFRYLGEELPYNLAVEINSFTVEKDLTRIHATIIVDKDNHKGIVIGKNGEKLKKIAAEARTDIEKLLAAKIFLQTWVKVKSGFAQQAKFLAQFEE